MKKLLLPLCVSRAGMSLVFMMYAGLLGILRSAWHMTTAEAGLIQTSFNMAYGSSVVVCSILADRFGARRVLLWSSWCTAISALFVAAFARSYGSAVVLLTIQGLAQGGTYASAILLVAQGLTARERGRGIGWLLAASSLGYLAAIAAVGPLAVRFGYTFALLVCATGSIVALVPVSIALRPADEEVSTAPLRLSTVLQIVRDRRTLLVTIAYTAHSWELLGMWAWIPEFAATVAGPPFDAAWRYPLIAIAIHGAGCLGAIAAGHISYRVGHRPLLLGFAIAGAVCSFLAGWSRTLPFGIVTLFIATYSFAAFSDSPVLTAEMSECIDEMNLGTALAIRSVCGFCAGGLAPLVFGAVLNGGRSGGSQWPAAFAVLGAGGLLAAVCAWGLPEHAERRLATEEAG